MANKSYKTIALNLLLSLIGAKLLLFIELLLLGTWFRGALDVNAHPSVIFLYGSMGFPIIMLSVSIFLLLKRRPLAKKSRFFEIAFYSICIFLITAIRLFFG